MQWLQAASTIVLKEHSCVRVVVAQIKGSAPREVGACMVVGATSEWGTIGGGALEFAALKAARDILQQGSDKARFTITPLGPNLGQCCGGQVTLCFQPLRQSDLQMIQNSMGRASDNLLLTHEESADQPYSTPTMDDLSGSGLPSLAAKQLRSESQAALLKIEGARVFAEALPTDPQKLFLFGAGHIGREIVHLLGRHAFEIYWLDARAAEFPASIPANTHQLNVANPVAHVATAPGGTDFLVMTHDHRLDLALCDAILRKADFRFLGLIGSSTKYARFKRRLQEIGHDPSAIARITCPIGISNLSSKKPEMIALSVASQLLSLPENT